MLTVGTTVLLTRLNKLLAEAGQTPMSRSTLSALIGGREYAQQTPDLCCCATCRNLGFVGYELLRQIVRDVVPCIVSIPDAARKSLASRLITRIDEEERFRSGEFLSHLKEEDTTPRHCLGLMCAPFNNLNFKSECEHARHDGARVDAPPTMQQQHPGRVVASDDWFDSCHICSSEDDSNESTEGMMCCNYCKIVAHKSCVAQRSSDLPDCKESPWSCESCVEQHDAMHHDTRCLKCEMHDYLVDDLRAVCALGLHDATIAARTSPDAEKFKEVATWGAACLESVNEDLLAYHAHLARDVNQDMFQKSMFVSVEQWHEWVTDLCDYWAKQGANKQKTGCCEGMANKGVSCHGRMFTYANPPQSVRDDHPAVPWETYPDTPEKGGPALCREYRRSWSDSSTQDSTHTAATRRAESKEFFECHPWITKNIGGISDGASNYSSTSAAIYCLLDDYCTVSCISVEGMGKDNIDRDNGSEQGKLRAARAHMDLTFTKEYIKACNARRHKGAVNARVEVNSSITLTAEQKRSIASIDNITDMKLRAKGANGSLVLWELFSRRLSVQAGHAVGYGRGRVLSKASAVFTRSF